MKIQDKAALVTGASGGIGKAIALELLRRGAYCALTARRQSELNSIVKEWDRENPGAAGKALALYLDVCDEASCRQALAAIEKKWGGLDILVNNAGYGVYGPAVDVPIAQIQAMFETNYFGACRLLNFSIPMLRKSQESSVVMVSSIAGKMGVPMMGHYAASKAAMNILSETLRAELAPLGINVVSILPGVTKTSFGKNAQSLHGARMPLSGWAGRSAEDVAKWTCDALEGRRGEVIVGLENRLLVAARRLLAPVINPYLGRFFADWD